MQYEPQKLRYSHEALADLIIASPHLKQYEIAAVFGKTSVWVGYIIQSDAFQAYLAKRREEILDPVLVMTVEERLKGLATKSVDVLMEKLETLPTADLALKALDLSSRALGYGARAAMAAQVNVQQNSYVVALPGKAPDSERWESAYSGGNLSAGSKADLEVTVNE